MNTYALSLLGGHHSITREEGVVESQTRLSIDMEVEQSFSDADAERRKAQQIV